MELIEREAAIAKVEHDEYYHSNEVRAMLEDLPTIDPIHAAGGCYCRECKQWGEDGRCEPRENGLIREYTKSTDFCSYGEPREAQDAQH